VVKFSAERQQGTRIQKLVAKDLSMNYLATFMCKRKRY